MIQSRIVKYYAKKDPNIAIKVIPGHFVSTHSHLNNYLDMTTMKTKNVSSLPRWLSSMNAATAM